VVGSSTYEFRDNWNCYMDHGFQYGENQGSGETALASATTAAAFVEACKLRCDTDLVDSVHPCTGFVFRECEDGRYGHTQNSCTQHECLLRGGVFTESACGAKGSGTDWSTYVKSLSVATGSSGDYEEFARWNCYEG